MLPKNPTFGQRPQLRAPAPVVRTPAAPRPTTAGETSDGATAPPEPPAGPVMAMAETGAQTGTEARWARRTPTRLGAQIQHATLAAPIQCTIRDTSSTGARLETSAQRGGNISRDRVPDQFTLFMPADRLEVDCEVMWRQGLLVGVRYTSPARRTAKQQPIKRPDPPKKPHTSLVKLLINPV